MCIFVFGMSVYEAFMKICNHIEPYMSLTARYREMSSGDRMLKKIMSYDWTTLKVNLETIWLPRKQHTIFLSPNMEEAMNKRNTKKVKGGSKEVVAITMNRMKLDIRDFF